MAGFSDLELSDDLFLTAPRVVQTAPCPCKIIMVGSLNQLYKAPHILLAALSEVCRSIDAHLTFVGGGQYQSSLQSQAGAAGIGDMVTFLGEISSRREIIDALDSADIFVLPSFQEGLPRAMVEAMARGLPCIGSSVGGIPELLAAEDLVPPGDSTALAHLILEVATNPERLSVMSRRNVARAQDFREEPLRQRRQAFYWALRKRTEQFLEEQRRTGLAHAFVP
jgi:glycosyltransferase involved in cell wall biosynthesis